MPHSGALAQSKTDTRPLPYFFPVLIVKLSRFGYKIVDLFIVVGLGTSGYKIVPQNVFRQLKIYDWHCCR